MSEMISVAEGFQYSVNIAYDLHADDKLKSYIPTQSALQLMEDILQSTLPTSTDRSRVLIGAYGKGKSHIVLTILALLMKRDLRLFEKLMPAVQKRDKLNRLIQNYYESNNKLLPVIITGSNTSLTQAFLLALQQTLKENDLLDIMPETNYKAAISVIERWKKDFPDTYQQFKDKISDTLPSFISRLEDYDIKAYEAFERIYPSLTAGSTFNPFVGFDVVQLYESVVQALKPLGYTGVYVIYDEFSKYLEANISEASVSDTKMLQDFAEKCNRSGTNQMHLMLISHKEIANYIDRLPKQKVDGWRGVSERFTHVHLNNNFTQTYEIIATVIQKKADLWNQFREKHQKEFAELAKRYAAHRIFADMQAEDIERTVQACYPLHPVSTFVLPRLSERVAQNERTLFTFLSSNGPATLPSFLKQYDDTSFEVVTPDQIYDYFEPLFKKEIANGTLHDIYFLTSVILNQLDDGSLEEKIVKTLSLIYMLEQFEKLTPTKNELIGIYSIQYPVPEIERALNNLIDDEYVIYLKRSNDYLQLKESSGVDIEAKIKDTIASQQSSTVVKKVLNASNFDSCIYPLRYNDEKEVTRYFDFTFIDESEVTEDVNWQAKQLNTEADGIVYAVIPHSKEAIGRIADIIKQTSRYCSNCVFIVPRKFVPIDFTVREYKAVETLKKLAASDKVLFDEYEVIYEDLREIINHYISDYTHPEKRAATYIYKGEEKQIVRKAALTDLLSTICGSLYFNTPVIINEAVNKNHLTANSLNSRSKIVIGLLRSELEPNLGLAGSGQEVSILRSTLIRTGVLETENGVPSINLHPKDYLMSKLMGEIEGFVQEARTQKMSFSDLYERLTTAKCYIGLRKGLVPIYVAAVFHEYKKEIIIYDRFSQVPLNNDTLLQIEAAPQDFTLQCLDWNGEKDKYVEALANVFKDYVIEAEKTAAGYGYVVSAMHRWYMELPKYAKESKHSPDGQQIDKVKRQFLRMLKQNIGTHTLLFERLPILITGQADCNVEIADAVAEIKFFYDQILGQLECTFCKEVKKLFGSEQDDAMMEKKSLPSVVSEWAGQLDSTIRNQLFADGTDRMLQLFFADESLSEHALTLRLAKLATDLNLSDWDADTQAEALENVKRYKATAEGFHAEAETDAAETVNGYQLTYEDEAGRTVTKRFDKVETSSRGKLLYNMIETAITGMGQAVSEQEKRQILMDVLRELC